MWGASTLRIAWRSLGRNRRRTTLALAAVGLAQALVVIYGGIVRGYGDFLLGAITGPMLGHVQAHDPRWRRERAMDLFLPDAPGILRAVRAHPGVESAQGRLYAPALAAVEAEGEAVLVVGVDPESEARPHGLLAGSPEASGLGGARALVGRQLARAKDIHEGAELALVGQGADGSLANELVTVAGLVDTPVDAINRSGVLLALPEAQQLFAMPGAVHEIVVRAREPARAQQLAAELSRLPALAGAELRDWRTIAPDLANVVEIVDLANWIVLLLVFLAAAAGVANTMMMATFERYRELGMLLALGARPGRLVGLIAAESLVLGLCGAALGAALGLAVNVLTASGGIDLSALAGGRDAQLSAMGIRFSMRIFPRVDWVDSTRALVAVALTSLLASLWPAARAARLDPVQAMRS